MLSSNTLFILFYALYPTLQRFTAKPLRYFSLDVVHLKKELVVRPATLNRYFQAIDSVGDTSSNV